MKIRETQEISLSTIGMVQSWTGVRAEFEERKNYTKCLLKLINNTKQTNNFIT